MPGDSINEINSGDSVNSFIHIFIWIKRVAEKFVPQLLWQEQKEFCTDSAQGLIPKILEMGHFTIIIFCCEIIWECPQNKSPISTIWKKTMNRIVTKLTELSNILMNAQAYVKTSCMTGYRVPMQLLHT